MSVSHFAWNPKKISKFIKLNYLFSLETGENVSVSHFASIKM